MTRITDDLSVFDWLLAAAAAGAILAFGLQFKDEPAQRGCESIMRQHIVDFGGDANAN